MIKHANFDNILQMLSRAHRPIVSLSLMLNYRHQRAERRRVSYLQHLRPYFEQHVRVSLDSVDPQSAPVGREVREQGRQEWPCSGRCCSQYIRFRPNPSPISSAGQNCSPRSSTLPRSSCSSGGAEAEDSDTISAACVTVVACHGFQGVGSDAACRSCSLYDYLFLQTGRLKPVLSRWKTYVLAVASSWAVVYYHLDHDVRAATRPSGFSVQTTSGINTGTYLLTSFNVIWTYIRLLVPADQPEPGLRLSDREDPVRVPDLAFRSWAMSPWLSLPSGCT